MSTLKLTIELVPSSSWQYNLRSLLKPPMWKGLREKVLEKYGHKCLVCGRVGRRPEAVSGPEGKMNAHEVWEYDDETHIQKLKDIIPLCFLCHGVKHIGFSSMRGSENLEKFIKHFMKINNCDRSTYQKHLKEEMEKFNERSKYEWQLDLEKLEDFE